MNETTSTVYEQVVQQSVFDSTEVGTETEDGNMLLLISGD